MVYAMRKGCFSELFYCSLLVLSVFHSEAVKLTNLSAPAVIDFRDELRLECQFDMGDEQLYAVKWYKDEQEFFRYVPNHQPHVITFPVFGVKLVGEETICDQTRCQLVLSELLRVKSGGSYRCEVSSEAPAFHLASGTLNITVAAVPKGKPTIEGLDPSYLEGDILSAKCTSAPSDPPQIINWYINNERAPTKFVRDLKTSIPDHDGLSSTWQMIRFVVVQKYTESGAKGFELGCEAVLPGAPFTSALRTIKNVALLDPDAHINNQRYFLYSSSSSVLPIAILLTITTLLVLIQR
ncbi:PREDICTED: uncharacterized protein LOC108568403 [Nicrophorus vespilloides]|uniref:Uncharacterized protein LOC108568403 n=1 Tax=Nicrophorus vespilloides TaxID=110193 RepID=A0ABM1NDQ6_NICVS|nr:PREDICTED: uncharacterized protein LOC108568403 [Nicrophorus vespilloides]